MAGWTTPTDRTTGYTVTAADWNVVEDNLTFLYGDAVWTNVPTFTNSWAASGTTPGYILVGRVVYLRGAMTAGTANTTAFTLPTGYRPSQQTVILCNNGTATTNVIQVAPAGTVTPLLSATCWLSGISFPNV